MTKKSIIIKGVVFTLIFALLWCGFERVLSYKWDTTIEHLASRYEYFEKEPEGTIDVFYIGSSPTFEAYVPAEIFNESGITSINFGTSNNRGLPEYYTLLYALKHQTPKLVVLDFVGFTDHAYVDYSYRDFITNVPDWDIKYQTIRATKELYPEINPLSYLFPLIHYHSRWESLTRDDFDENTENRIYYPYTKGNCMRTEIKWHDWSEAVLLDQPDAVVGEFHVDYYRKIIETCKERNIDVLLAIPPRCITTVNEYNAAKALAEETGITFWDFSTAQSWQEIGFDPANAFLDDEHFNIIGARIYSNYVARRLAAEFPQLKDHRGEKGYESWEEAYEEYKYGYLELYTQMDQ